jgi:kynureninase
VLEAGVENIRERSKTLTSLIVEKALERGIEIRSPMDADDRSGMVCLQFEGSESATETLVESGVIVDWRPDCGLRVSPHFYNTEDELGVFFERLDAVREKAGV